MKLREIEYKEYSNYLLKVPNKGIDGELLLSFINDTIMIGIETFDKNRGVNIKTYMYKILENKIKQYFIRKKKVYFTDIDNEYDLYIEHNFDYNFDIDIKYNKVVNLIHRLPPKYMLIGIWFFIEQIPQKEIADVLYMNINTLKTRINTIKKMIRKEYRK